jgi:hypothetical protein
LAFASAGAASAGQVNIPNINIPRPNIPRPQINIPQPQIRVQTPHLRGPNVNAPVSGSQTYGHMQDLSGRSPTGQPMPQQQSTTGTTSGNQFSNVSGGAGPSFRCRPKGGVSNCP